MPHISWSQIKMLQRCGKQYEFRYIEGKKIPPGVAAHIGSSTHQSIEKNLKYKIEQGELLPLDVVQDIARDALLTNWEMRGVLLLPEEKSKGIKQVKGEAIDQAVALSRLHRVKAAPKIKPVSVEREWELDIKDAGWSIKGRIDIETPRGIRDTKTAGRSPVKDAAEKDSQLTMYALAYYVLNRKMPAYVALDYLVKTKEPKFVSQRSERRKEDFQALLNRITAAIKAIEAGIFIPANEDNWMCSPRWCGYYSICPYASIIRYALMRGNEYVKINS